MDDADLSDTARIVAPDRRPVARWRITVTSGASAGAAMSLDRGLVRVGCSRSKNDLVVRDPHVSRLHLELHVSPGGVRVVDLASKNGTYYCSSRIDAVDLSILGGRIELGLDSAIEIAPELADELPEARSQCGRLIGASAPMRMLYGQIDRIAQRAATVLIQGETGSGKELVAEA